MAAPISTRRAISAKAARRSTNIRSRIASSAAFVSICAISRRAPRSRRRTSKRPGPEGKVNALVHKACLELDITHMESLCNLEALLGQGEFQFIGLPLKWREGTGSPIRAVAVFDD